MAFESAVAGVTGVSVFREARMENASWGEAGGDERKVEGGTDTNYFINGKPVSAGTYADQKAATWRIPCLGGNATEAHRLVSDLTGSPKYTVDGKAVGRDAFLESVNRVFADCLPGESRPEDSVNGETLETTKKVHTEYRTTTGAIVSRLAIGAVGVSAAGAYVYGVPSVGNVMAAASAAIKDVLG